MKKNVGLLGCAMLAASVFMPAVTMPLFGEVTFFESVRNSYAMFHVASCFAVASFSAFLIGRGESPIPALIAAICIPLALFELYLVNDFIEVARHKMMSGLRGNPFSGMVSLATRKTGLSWGWAVLVTSLLFIVYSGEHEAKNVKATEE